MSTDKSPLMLVVAGFFGSLIAVGRASHGNLRDNLLAILTPVVFEVTGIAASQQTMSAMAFLLGVLGQRGVEIIIGKVFPEAKTDA